MQIPLGELSAYGLQAWLLSVTGAAMGITKAFLMVKGSGNRNGNGNGKLLLAKDEGKFEIQIVSLTERVVRLNELMYKTQTDDRDKWAPALSSLIAAQSTIMSTLEAHADKTTLHQDRIRIVWGELLGAIGDLTEKIGTLPCTKRGFDIDKTM